MMVQSDLTRREPVDVLLELLGRARALAAAHLALRTGLWSLTCVLCIVLAARLLSIVAPTITTGWGGSWNVPAVGAAVLLIVLFFSFGLAASCAPTLAHVGKRADQIYDLQERISTAVEVSSRMRSGGTVEGGGDNFPSLLVQDAARSFQGARPARLIERRVRWSLLAFGAAAVLLVGAEFVPVPPVIQSSTDGATASDASAASLQATVAPVSARDVRQAAAMVAADAGKLNDSYLQALSQSLQDLGRKLASGALDSSVAEQQVRLAQELLTRAYAQHVGQEILHAPQPSAGKTTSEAISSFAASRVANEASRPVVALPALTPSRGRSTLSDFVRRLERNASARTGASKPQAIRGGPATSSPDQTSPLAQAPQRQDLYWSQTAREAQIVQMQALYAAIGTPGGRPAGPAPQSTRGPGDAAGHGSQPLSAGLGASESPPSATNQGAKVVLPASEIAGGSRIRIDAAPKAKRTNVLDVTPGAAVAAAQPSETALPVGQILDAGRRSAVARYFLPAGGASSASVTTGKDSAP